MDEDLAELVAEIRKEHAPVQLGYRRVWAILRFGRKIVVNRKKVQRLMQLNRWQAKPIRRPRRPRQHCEDPNRAVVDPKQPIWVEKPNTRWCADATKFEVAGIGWCSAIPIVDCASRECIAMRIGIHGRAREACDALREALVIRFGGLKKAPQLQLRTDNGSIFLAHKFVEELKSYGIEPEYTPYRCPSANGIAERFIKTLKEECVWHHRFRSIDEAERIIRSWIEQYNTKRQHSSLGYQTPRQHAEKMLVDQAA